MTEPPVARLTSPAQLVAALPLWLGYVPTQSLVVACQHERGGRLGLTMRFDLPDPAEERALARQVVSRVRRQGAARVLLAVYCSEPGVGGALPRAGLVGAVLDGLEAKRVVPTDALLVREDRYWSYLCRDLSCCPTEGRSVAELGSDDAELGLLAAELVLQGRATLPSREALEASLSGPTAVEADAAAKRCQAAFEELLEDVDADRDAWMERTLALWTATATRFSVPPAVLHADDAAALAVSLGELLLRDTVATRFETPGMRALLTELCRRTPAPWDAPVCTLHAWAAYCDGGGAEVTITLERALASLPDYALARLVRDALLGQVDPQVLRRITLELAEDDRIRRWAA